MISNEIIDEVISTSINKKFLSKKQILRFTEQIIESLENFTKNRFNGVYFDKTNWNNYEYATTNFENGTIAFNNELIYSSFKERHSIIDSYLTCNLEILSIIVHEIQHLREPYKMMTSKLDNTLIRYGNLKYFQERFRKMYPSMSFWQFQRYYLKCYNFIPTERIAEIDSYKMILDSILNFEDFKEKYKTEFEIVRQSYILNNMGIYDKLRYPLKHYFKKIGKPELLDKFSFEYIDSLMIEDKLRSGFIVDRKDIDMFEKKIKSK